MNQNELLEGAARAAGYVPGETFKFHQSTGGPMIRRALGARWVSWNPLQSCEDAMRLAIQLSIAFKYERNAPPELRVPRVCAIAITDEGEWFSEEGQDEVVASCFAIVRAACRVYQLSQLRH